MRAGHSGRGQGRRRPGSAEPGYFRKRGRLWEGLRIRQQQARPFKDPRGTSKRSFPPPGVSPGAGSA